MELKKIIGEKVVLRAIGVPGELEQLRLWRNEPENHRWSFTQHQIAPEEHRNWFEKISKAEYRGVYAIAVKETDTLIGYFQYLIHPESESAEFGVMIGGAEFRGKGYGEEAEMLLTRELAKNRGVKKAIMEVFTNNTGAVKFYEKQGYKTERVVPEGRLQEGKPADVYIMTKRL